MNEWQTNWLLEKMLPIPECSQLKRLELALESVPAQEPCSSGNLLELFLSAKEVEGCSQKTISYYRDTIAAMAETVNVTFTCITTDDLRKYLSNYETQRKVSKVAIDNIRRILSTFFSWLEDEDCIVKSPVRWTHHVKTPQRVKHTISDKELETLRENCGQPRDLASVDLLAPTGSAQRITSGGVERRLKSISIKASVEGIHPHKFRRTLVTTAIEGMPIEQAQKMLGHGKIETTMHYAMVKQSNAKASHRRYLHAPPKRYRVRTHRKQHWTQLFL